MCWIFVIVSFSVHINWKYMFRLATIAESLLALMITATWNWPKRTAVTPYRTLIIKGAGAIQICGLWTRVIQQ